MVNSIQINNLKQILAQKPNAQAAIAGSEKYPAIRGIVNFYQTPNGVLLAASIVGLPNGTGPCGSRMFGFHIHEGTSCTGNAQDPFADTKTHYNPGNCEHPHHAGDLPPLFENAGQALMTVLTNRFKVSDVIGRTVVIHSHPDDFTTQPSGNSGEKIACGLIQK